MWILLYLFFVFFTISILYKFADLDDEFEYVFLGVIFPLTYCYYILKLPIVIIDNWYEIKNFFKKAINHKK